MARFPQFADPAAAADRELVRAFLARAERIASPGPELVQAAHHIAAALRVAEERERRQRRRLARVLQVIVDV